jgi:hypothetical protein
MILAGIVVTVAGWGLAVASLGITQSTGARLGLVLVGIAISLVGILGVLNQHYLKNAIWRK